MKKLGDRFKAAEKTSDFTLVDDMPVIIRLDGKAFHTYTKGFDKPFDESLHKAMRHAAGVLCKEIQNSRFAYTQSDEISILIHKKRDESQLWYGNRVQKMASVAASVCTMAFNDSIMKHPDTSSVKNAYFDARLFNINECDVLDYFFWRQADAIRNSIATLAQANFSSKQLHRKNRHEMQIMLATKGILWDELEEWKKLGSIITKQWREQLGPLGEIAHRSFWSNADICPDFHADEQFINSMLEQEVSSI
ncbi:MAG: tRNA(His) guanylyltransferase Thg1 family protein [Candidatus Ranarchaeia archaeon]